MEFELFLSMVDLKKRLIERIKETSDEDVLREVYRLLELELDQQEIYELSEDQRSVVNEARKEISNGDYLTNEQSNEVTNQWLKDK